MIGITGPQHLTQSAYGCCCTGARQHVQAQTRGPMSMRFDPVSQQCSCQAVLMQLPYSQSPMHSCRWWPVLQDASGHLCKTWDLAQVLAWRASSRMPWTAAVLVLLCILSAMLPRAPCPAKHRSTPAAGQRHAQMVFTRPAIGLHTPTRSLTHRHTPAPGQRPAQNVSALPAKDFQVSA